MPSRWSKDASQPRLYPGWKTKLQLLRDFARGKGLSASDLQVREIDGGNYVVAVIQQAGQRAIQVLAQALLN